MCVLQYVPVIFRVADKLETDCIPPNLFSSCKKLRRIGFGAWAWSWGTDIQGTLPLITSKNLSIVSIELAHCDWMAYYLTREMFYRWLEDLDRTLCYLADRRLANGEPPLVLEITWWRVNGHEGNCGMTYPDTILPGFREKGLIRFAESTSSDCKRCAEILAEKS